MSDETGTAVGEQASTPEYRFPEFKDAPAWQEKELGSVLSYERPDPYVVSDANYVASGTPVLTANKSFVLGYTQEADGIYSDVPAIIFDDFTTDKKYVDFPFKVKSSAIKILKAKGRNHLKTIFEAMGQIKFDPKDHKRYYISQYQAVKISLPEPVEQKKIADCLTSLDDLIAAEERKLRALRRHKDGLVQRLFPCEGHTAPNWRFPAFRTAPAWVSAPMGDVFDTATGGTPERSVPEYWGGEIPWITTSLVDFGVIERAGEFITKAGLANSSAKLFPKDTVLVAMYGQGKTRGKVALLGIEATTNQACAAVLPRSGINPHFTFLNLGSRYEELRALSNAGGQENLSQGLVRSLPFSYPDDEREQEAIVECLSALDRLVTNLEHKLHALRRHKSALRQGLFPAWKDDR